jgi:hypothetical protein
MSHRLHVDPQRVTKFDRTDAELQAFYLFSLMVAGKNAATTSAALDRLLVLLDDIHPGSPFAALTELETRNAIGFTLRAARTGKYALLTTAIWQTLGVGDGRIGPPLDLRTVAVPKLEQIHGIGPKTARYFVVHTRPDQRYAVLDTHLLAHLRENGIAAPKATPPAKQYAKLEQLVLSLADAAGMTPAEYDLAIWNQRSKNGLRAAA